MAYFQVKQDWKHRTAVVFASGPSVRNKDINIVREARQQNKCRVIAINAMYQLVEYADILYFCDFKFYKWHAIDDYDPEFVEYQAPKYTISPELFPSDVIKLKQASDEGYGLSRDPSALETGKNSTYQAMNLAFLKGVNRIVIIGLDMKPNDKGVTHCHEPHFIPTPIQTYENVLKGAYFDSLAKELKKESIEVINCSVDSAVHCFKKKPIEEVIF